MTETALDTPTATPDIALAYQGLRQALLGFLRNKVGDNSVAEDLLHDVFLKALSAIERGDSPSNLTGWLYTIAKNSVIDHYRTQRPTDPLPEEQASPQPDDNVVEQDLARCLQPLTETLPPLYRTTLIATNFGGQTMQVLANQEGVSVSAVKSRVSRGRQMLKQRLLACCKVEVSNSGQVLDFASHEPASPGAPCCGC